MLKKLDSFLNSPTNLDVLVDYGNLTSTKELDLIFFTLSVGTFNELIRELSKSFDAFVETATSLSRYQKNKFDIIELKI